jgi:hypothetical protein
MAIFEYHNLTFTRSYSGDQIVIKGEITNRSNRNYSAVAVRVILFDKDMQIANVVITVNGVPAGRTKEFEHEVRELGYERNVGRITRCEAYTESAY